MSHAPFQFYSGALRPSILFVSEFLGDTDIECGRVLSGASGREFFAMLGEAGEAEWRELLVRTRKFGLGWVGERDRELRAQGLALTSVLALRPPDGKIESLCVGKKDLPKEYSLAQIDQGKYLQPSLLGELDRLRIELVESKPTLVVALGSLACWALLGSKGIGALRGTVAAEGLSGLGLKVLPTYGPSAVMKNWGLRPIVVGDLVKAKRESAFAEIRRPDRKILLNPTLEEVEQWTRDLLANPASPVACDTETAKGQIIMVGFALSASEAIVIPFRNFLTPLLSWPWFIGPSLKTGLKSLHYWPEADEVRAWQCVCEILLAPNPKIFQNGLYDIQYFLAHGLRVREASRDSMLLHHSILPELQKGLGFLGSVYTSEPAWKLMRRRRGEEPEKADE